MQSKQPILRIINAVLALGSGMLSFYLLTADGSHSDGMSGFYDMQVRAFGALAAICAIVFATLSVFNPQGVGKVTSEYAIKLTPERITKLQLTMAKVVVFCCSFLFFAAFVLGAEWPPSALFSIGAIGVGYPLLVYFELI